MDSAAEFPAINRRDWYAIGLLLLLSGLIHAWLLSHTEVAARDCIGFIRYAWQLESHPLPDIMRRAQVHPGYPVAIHFAKPIVALFYHASDPLLMEKTAQVVSCFFGLLLVIPMYLLGRELFSPWIGFCAALCFQCLPLPGRVLSDGLSEATFYFFFAMSAWQGVRGLRCGRPLAFVLCGAFGALAYLTRPEGVLVVLATGAALATAVAVRVFRHSWLKAAACGLALSASAIIVGCPLYLITGKISPKPTTGDVLRFGGHPDNENRSATTIAAPPLAVTGIEKNTLHGLRAVINESIKGFDYVGWVPALLGLWWCRSHLARQPGHWVLLLMALGISLTAWRVATLEGYLSDRHVLVLIFCGTFWMAAGLQALPTKLAALAERWRWSGIGRLCSSARAPVILLAFVVLGCLPRTLQRLHYNRSGFRDTGLWLAQHTSYLDPIVDPYCWSHYYAGRVFIEGRDTAEDADPDHVPATYVILEEAHNPHPNLPEVATAEKLVKQPHEEVYRWKGYRGREYAEIAVYRLSQ